MKAFILLLKESFAAWKAHNAPKMAAALAYYATFSMAPLLVLVVGIAGWVVEQDEARHAIITQLSTLMGREGGAIAETILTQSAKQAAGLWATIIGFVILLVGASGVFAELQESLNTIWEVPPREFPWRALIRGRLLSFAMVFALGFLMLVSLVLSAGIAAVSTRMELWAPGFGVLWEGVNSLVTFVVITLLFAAIYRYLPDVRITWRDVWTGAALTALLFVLGKFLLGIYLGHTAFASAYGAVGSLVIILAWIFYSSLIFFFGAEFTNAFARRHGSHCSRPPLHRTAQAEGSPNAASSPPSSSAHS
ncbi:YihY/virulence factor BrkB family protein [Prosthecobacter sp.]|uniref:YihY/virulence factor BrkB family protein n=1 Tax=Prosthecobacter sp. TaxID=1965333 RepID=UPI003784B7E9